MTQHLLITASILCLTACQSGVPSKETKYEGITEVCLNGVVYYQTRNTNSYYNYAPKFNTQSKVITCYEQESK